MTLTFLNNTLYYRIDPHQIRCKVLVLLCHNVVHDYYYLQIVGPVFMGSELVWYHLFSLHRFTDRLILSGPESHSNFIKKYTLHQFEVLHIARLQNMTYQTIVNVAMAHQQHNQDDFFERIYTYLTNRYTDPIPCPPNLFQLLLQAL